MTRENVDVRAELTFGPVPCRDAVNMAVLRLIDYGELAKLENKWWFTNSECKEAEVRRLTPIEKKV